MINKLIITAVVIVLALGGFFWYRNSISAQSSPQISPLSLPSPAPTTGPVTESVDNTTPATVSVTLTQSGFSPQTVTISAGDQVTWTNQSGQTATVNSDPHPTHGNYPPLNLGQFADGNSLSLVFPTSGTYGFHNHLNPNQTGTVIVK